MSVTRAYKTELDLSNQQITACKRHAGAARYAYNWGLRRKQETYAATGTSPSAIDLHRELNALKKSEVPWMYHVSKCAPHEALRNLDTAFAHFIRRCKLKREGKLTGQLGYPQPKTKKQGLGSFRLTEIVRRTPRCFNGSGQVDVLRLSPLRFCFGRGTRVLAAGSLVWGALRESGSQIVPPSTVASTVRRGHRRRVKQIR